MPAASHSETPTAGNPVADRRGTASGLAALLVGHGGPFREPPQGAGRGADIGNPQCNAQRIEDQVDGQDEIGKGLRLIGF